MDTDNTFQTDSYLLATFLLCQACNLVSIDRTNPRRMIFHFLETEKRKSLTEEFLAYKTVVEPHRFYMAQRDLKALIYQKVRSKYV